MKFHVGSAALLAGSVVAKEMPVDEVKAAKLYDSGVIHNALMSKKMDFWAERRENGFFDSSQYPELGYAKCVDGWATAIEGDRSNTFKCQNADLYHFLSHEALGGPLAQGSSSWGWTSDDGREFVAIGQGEGAAFVEITTEGKMIYLGRLPQYSVPSQWREIRSYKHYMVIGSEAVDHGVQIFDMRKLLDLTEDQIPYTFDAKEDLASHISPYLPLGRAHNIVVNEELGYAAAVGAQPRTDPLCRSGLSFIDLADPENPVALGCAAGDGYVHDAQCLVYRGPDKRYEGIDICYGYNEDTLTIYDVTDKANVTNIISRTSYEGAAYTHQGWVLDVNNQTHLVLDDEYDEVDGLEPAADGFPVTYFWDITDLENPKQTGIYKSKTRAIDHNQYIVDGFTYQSAYGAGLRVLDVRSVPEDPTGGSVCEAAFFDIFPEDDVSPGGGDVAFVGSWSSYPFFKSGYVFINTIERGAFVVKLTSHECPPEPKCNADNCLRALRASSIPGRLEESQELCHVLASSPIKEASALPKYAQDGCSGDTVARASSACACLPAATPAP